MDTGSEFAMVMTHMVKDTFKDTTEILKLIFNWLSKNAEIKRELGINGFGLRELSRKTGEFDGLQISEDIHDKFVEEAAKVKLKYCDPPNFNNPGYRHIYFNKEDLEKVNDIFEKIKEANFERMSEEEIGKGIESILENIQIQVEKEEQDVSMEELSQFDKMRQNDGNDFFDNTFNVGEKIKNKEKNLER